MTEAFNGLEWLKAEREALGKQIKQIELRLHAVQVLIDGVEENRRSNGHAPVPSIAPQVNGQRRPHILIATMREQGVNGLTNKEAFAFSRKHKLKLTEVAVNSALAAAREHGALIRNDGKWWLTGV